MSQQFVAVRARKRTVFLVAALSALLPLVGLGAVPRADAADPTLSHVGTASSFGNRTNHAVTLPSAIQGGDTLVLFMTVNSLNGGELTAPAGWTLLQSKDGTATRGRAWTKQATAGDAGATVTVPTTGTAIKDTMSVGVYRSVGGTSSVTASAGTAGPSTATTSFTAPSVPVAQAGSWLVNAWSEKSSSTQTWTKPSNSTTRSTPAMTGGGKVSSLIADSNAPVSTGTAAARTATTSASGGNGQMFSVVISPGTGGTPANQPPVPSFTTSCTAMTCNFNAGATTDPDNDPLTYTWNFGDGSNGTGVTASRTYTTAGARTVTLTVGDGTTTAQTTRGVTPSTPTTTGALSYVGSASTAGSRTSHTVRIPNNVEAGDTLVVFLTVNSLSGSLSGPSGWTVLQNKNGSVTRGRAWTKRATAADAGANVTARTSSTLKDTMTVAAYRSTGGNSSVTASAQIAGGTTTATSHSSPTVAVAQAGSWLVSSWSERSSTAQTWTPPANATSRRAPATTSTNKISSLVADSNGPVATGTAAARVARSSRAVANTQKFSVVISPGTVTPPVDPNPLPNHAGLVPRAPRTDMPRISNGEIWDIEVVGNRVFVAGTFSSIQNQRTGNTTSYSRGGLASYSLTTGLVDAAFNPDFNGADILSVEATPDGTKLYVGGAIATVNGVAKKGLVRLDMTTGAAVSGFTANTDARVQEIATTNSTVYLGGRFIKVNGVPRVTLAAVDATTGDVDTGFSNDITSGIGVNGGLGVQSLETTRDQTKLLVVHTGRRVAGQERLGIALIDTASKQLLPWRTRLWDDNLQFVGGIQRIYGAAIAPDDSYFVVTSGSGGDRPPINDTAVAYSTSGGDNVEPRWVSRAFDSIYSVAISEKAVYLGGHFAWNESPSAPDPWPGQDDIGYGTGQGLSAYALGDGVVNREHLGALNPADGKALEWDPGSNSYEGNKAMVVTPRGLITGGDGNVQGGNNVGRLAFFDFQNEPAPNGVDTAITEPIMGRVIPSGEEFTVKGTASATGGVNRVEVGIQNRGTGQYLQDDLTTWGSSNTINANLTNPGAGSTTWSLPPVKISGNVKLLGSARTVAVNATQDVTPDLKKFETFGLTDAPPTVTYTAPSSGLLRTKTFTVTGNTADDKGVVSLSMTLRDGSNRYLQDDGTVDSSRNTFRITPDVPGATNSTWSREFTVPSEDTWRAQIRATDTSGQSSLDTTDRTWTVTENGQTPTVAISAPGSVVPPTAPQLVTVQPGDPMTFSGTATDDGTIKSVHIALLNNSTGENLTTDGTWGIDNGLNLHKLPAGNVTAPTGTDRSYRWTWTTPQDLTPGNYTFAVVAVDNDDLSTPQAQWAIMTMNAVVTGDAPPRATITPAGAQPPSQDLTLDLAGNATDDLGVAEVRLVLKDLDTGKYLQADGTAKAGYASVPATLGDPDPANPVPTSKTWSKSVDLPVQGNWNVTAYAVDTAGQRDLSTAGATARYPIYPGDTPPVFTLGLLAPTEGTTFSDGKIFVSGRAEDDQAMAKVEVAIVNSAGQYLSSSGTFTSTTESWRTAFLTSPGTVGSNFSYTTPVVPPGAYTVKVRATDQHDLVTTDPPARNVTVEHPPGNTAPVAVQAEPVCTRNVCQFDARGSTDENATTLTYAWNFGNGTGTGPNPKRTYTAAGTYTVTLTATDEWGAVSSSTPPVTKTVTIDEPTDNVAPTPVINQPNCSGLTCNFSAVGTVDPNTGDTVSYMWNFGDPTTGVNNSRAAASGSHAFSAPGEYTVTLTATDGWGRATTITRQVTVSAPGP